MIVSESPVVAPSRRRQLSPVRAFWIIALVFFTVMGSSAAPSPLYPLYQSTWGFGASTLTVVFAVYVFALLAALLTVGSLSDHVGRKPVVVAALLVLVASQVVFVFADGVGWLIAARIVQGLAAGSAMGALTAAIIDLQPTEKMGPLVSSVAPAFGLGTGGIAAGLLVQFAPAPTTLVYVLIAAALLVLVALVLLVPESSARSGFTDRRHAVRVLTPRIGLPSSIRSRFWPVVPALIATWSLGGFHLSLGPSIMGSVFGLSGAIVGGLDIFTMFTAGALGAASARSLAPRTALIGGAVTLAVGIVINMIGLHYAVAPLYFVGTAVSGFGWGITFLGAMSIVGAIAPAEHRGSVFATTLVLSYLAFSVPAIVAGVAIHSAGLLTTATVYGTVVAVLALGAAATTVRQATPAHS
ncbi:MAG: MFS transporter [Rhodococcus sp. (in: high G+C Gram-positive bacteria)]